LIASKIFDQGIDIPELDALILAGSGKSSARALQRIGRVIRSYPSKKWANVIEFWDNTQAHKDDIVNFAEGRKTPSSYASGEYVYWIAYLEDEAFCNAEDYSGNA
jgi:superfamily II DNA or RNA helicase